MKVNEMNSRRLFEMLLENNGYKYSTKVYKNPNENCYLEDEKSENFKIDKLLVNASKRGNGKGYPDFIISLNKEKQLIIICETKASTKYHESKDRQVYDKYAVDGVLLYSSFLSKEYDVVSIALSGETVSDFKISTFLQLKEEKTARLLSNELMYTFDGIVDLYKNDTIKQRQSYHEILDYARTLNEELHSIDIPHDSRALLISGILIALQDKTFVRYYNSYEKPIDLAQNLYETINRVLSNDNISGTKKANMLSTYGFITSNEKLSLLENIDGQKNTILKDLITEIKEKVKDGFLENYKYYDVLGKFYTEFLRYANGDASLGIVLTPMHITELFVDLANVNENSIVYDNCCGTCGFLISAMKRMLSLTDEYDLKKKEMIYNNQLIGTEADSKMFALACSNMMIRGDGKSNILYGDCFEKTEEIKKLKPTIGFLNPPYSKDKKKDSDTGKIIKVKGRNELEFIYNNLECLERGSTCIAIVPIRCCFEKNDWRKKLLQKHTLKAVMSMNPELFINSDVGTVTCIMVFTAKIPHKETNMKTWLADWKNDGFRKNKIEGRADLDNNWSNIKEQWLNNYRERIDDNKISVLRYLTGDDDWSVEAYLPTDYSDVKTPLFEKTIKDYVSYLFNTNQIDNISNKPILENYKNNTLWDFIDLRSLFYVGSEYKDNDLILDKKSKTKSDLIHLSEGNFPYITTSSENNGANGFYDEYSAFGNCLTIDSAACGKCFYQNLNFSYSDHVEKLYPKFKNFNVYIGLFIATIINKEHFRYSYGRKYNQDRIKNTKLLLPVIREGNETIPNFLFMENYIKSLKYSSIII